MNNPEEKIKIFDNLKELLEGIPFVKIKAVEKEGTIGEKKVDAFYNIESGEKEKKIVVEAMSIGEPRQVRSKIYEIKDIMSAEPDGYGMIAAPYISEDSARICKENGIGLIDLAGNCLISFDRVFVEHKNFPNPKKEKRRHRSLLSPKAIQVIRVLLSAPGNKWMIKDLAREARVSLGMAFKIKEKLLELEYAKEEGKKIIVIKPVELLNEWAGNYSLEGNVMKDYFGYGHFSNLEKDVAAFCRKEGIPYALTLFSAAELVAPHTRSTRGFIYVKERASGIAESLGLREVPTGANLTLIEPGDEGVFYGMREIQEMSLVSDVQIYLDLMAYKDQGEEAAKFLLEERIITRWK